MKNSLNRECRRILKDVFGLESYRPGQKEAVKTLLSGRDVMCILPTGAGKSLCWQIPAIVRNRLTIVISPLIALMRDQVEHLHESGIPAVTLDSLMSAEEKSLAMEKVRAGAVRIVYVSPERLEQKRFQQLCQELEPWMIVVDEAHCVVQWGEKFRPAYSMISEYIAGLKKRPVICALTATADSAMQQEIVSSIGMKRTKRILLPIVRENLVYSVRTTLDTTAEILRISRESPCKTVIFCRSRFRTEQLAEMLKKCGVEAAHYHAGIAREDRIRIQQNFMDGTLQMLCATSAFGLGVDIPDIRRIIHDYLPDDIIDYVQQSGRAGRDGIRSECLLLLSPNELVSKAKVRFYEKNPFRRWYEEFRYVRKLDRLIHTVMSAACIPAGIAAAFGKKVPSCGICSACTKGRLLQRRFSYGFKRQRHVRLWLLLWQRSSLAEQQGRFPQEIVPDHAMKYAAEKLVFPDGVYAPVELERMLRHFRHERMNKSETDWIS